MQLPVTLFDFLVGLCKQLSINIKHMEETGIKTGENMLKFITTNKNTIEDQHNECL